MPDCLVPPQNMPGICPPPWFTWIQPASMAQDVADDPDALTLTWRNTVRRWLSVFVAYRVK